MMNEDLERTGPSMDTSSQRDQQVRAKATNDATTTSAETAALVDVYTNRLQILTVVTTFLASIDGEFFSLTNQSSRVSVNMSLKTHEFMYSCFSGALIFHVCATILGYTASFALVRYQPTRTATTQRNEQRELSSPSPSRSKHYHPPLGPSSFDPSRMFLEAPTVTLEAVSRTFTDPLPLLRRCYHTTLVLGGIGFLATILGITTYAWKGLQKDVGIFTVACLGVSLVAGLWAVFSGAVAWF